MGIFQGSRYTHTPLTLRETTLSFMRRERESFSKVGAWTYIFQAGDSLDKLAFKCFGSPRLWWVLLEANPRFKLECEVKPGDTLMIPAYEEVRKSYGS